jgi:hypothetical protein
MSSSFPDCASLHTGSSTRFPPVPDYASLMRDLRHAGSATYGTSNCGYRSSPFKLPLPDSLMSYGTPTAVVATADKILL